MPGAFKVRESPAALHSLRAAASLCRPIVSGSQCGFPALPRLRSLFYKIVVVALPFSFLLFSLRASSVTFRDRLVGFLRSSMAAINEYRGSSDSPNHHTGYEKGYGSDNVVIAGGSDLEPEVGHHLHRGLKARQITMIAIGGAIGTGLIIGTYVIGRMRIPGTVS